MRKLFLCLVMAAVTLVGCSDPAENNEPTTPESEETTDPEVEPDEPEVDTTPCVGDIVETSANAIVAEMGLGWNISNNLDAPTETGWGNPVITQELVDAIQERGFKTIRVPVSWDGHMGSSPSYTVDETWMARVEEVVQYGLRAGLYVILDVHHDDDWCMPSYATLEASKTQLVALWKQIANRFEKYNEYLIFETINEPRLVGDAQEWSGGSDEGQDCVNQLHAAAVTAIRGTGGNNALRQIMVSSYGAAVSSAVDGLVLPNDDKIIVSIHSYNPYLFCLGTDTADDHWGEEDKAGCQWELNQLKATFIDNGIPIVMGEWGVVNTRNEEDVIAHHKFFAEECVSRGIVPVLWDFSYISRVNYGWKRASAIDAAFEGAESGAALAARF